MSDTNQYSNITSNSYIDLQIAIKIVKVLMTPFEDTKAFKLKIIDKNGNQLKQSHELKTNQERDAYSPLMKLLYRIKQLFEKYNIKRAQAQPFVTLAGALKFIRENENLVGFEHFMESNIPSDIDIKFVKLVCEEIGTGQAILPVADTRNSADGLAISPKNKYKQKNKLFRRHSLKSQTPG